jgi:hypothetical protein
MSNNRPSLYRETAEFCGNDRGWSGLGRINAALADAKKARLAELGGIPLIGSPEDFGRLVAAEAEKWAR